MLCRWLRLERSDVDRLAFLCPFHERLETAGRDEHALFLAGCRVYNNALLQIRHLAALGFDVAVAHVMAGERGFAGNGADFRHTGVI